MDLVVFDLDAQRLGIASESVVELLRAVAITPLVGAPEGVEGVIDLRGAIVPVFDLRARLALPARAVRPSEHMLVCEAGAETVAIRADRIVEIRSGVDSETLPTAADPMMNGLVRLPDGLVVICDLASALTAEDFEAVSRAR